MKLSQPSQYRADSFPRPQGHIMKDDSLNMFGVCFSWGELDLSEKIFENIRYYVDAFQNNSDATNPFGFDTSLSSLENALKAGTLLASDVIYRLINKQTLSNGAEFALVARRGAEVAVVQVGQPSVFLLRTGMLIPLLSATDHIDGNIHTGAFLPKRLLGVESRCFPQITSFQIQKGDEIILLAHTAPCDALYSSDVDLSNIGAIHRRLIELKPQSSFWISKLLTES